MSFWEVLSLIGFGATVLGAWLITSSYYNGRATRALMRDLATHFDRRHIETQEVIRSMQEGTADITREMQAETRALFERMDERADQRQRETHEVIRTLRS